MLANRADVYDSLGQTEQAREDRAAAERAAAERATSGNHELDEARAFLDYLQEGDVWLTIASNGHDIGFGCADLRRETFEKLDGNSPRRAASGVVAVGSAGGDLGRSRPSWQSRTAQGDGEWWVENNPGAYRELARRHRDGVVPVGE